ncbi:MAG: lytic transglycosylase domain-containing protein [Proteobacteria bacterium]|nr:lytic transglycosylase domain-containing protein [Pseudomonadota bacterium]
MASALLIHGVPIECINQAAVTYYVPAKVIISVIATEGGNVGVARQNKNGTYDYGPMQVNSSWLPMIKKYGYTPELLQNDPCVNVMAGTWILSTKIAQATDYWSGVANYHSVTPLLNTQYKLKVLSYYQMLSQILPQIE